MKHLDISDPTCEADVEAFVAEAQARFDAAFAAVRASWQQPRHLRVVDGGGLA